MYKPVLLFSLLMILGSVGCASYRTAAVRPESVPLVKDISQTQPDLAPGALSENKADLSLAA
jgi:hypothetical protein